MGSEARLAAAAWLVSCVGATGPVASRIIGVSGADESQSSRRVQAEKALFGELERSERACKAELDAVKARRPTAQRPVPLLGSLSTLPLPLTPSARTPPCFALSQTSAAHICAGTWARPCHICAGTGLTAPTSAPGLGSPLPHLRRDWARVAPTPAADLCAPSHICTKIACAREPAQPTYIYTAADIYIHCCRE